MKPQLKSLSYWKDARYMTLHDAVTSEDPYALWKFFNQPIVDPKPTAIKAPRK